MNICPRCSEPTYECDTCGDDVCMGCKKYNDNHQLCVNCGNFFVCHSSGVCEWCVVQHPYHFITDRIAVGGRSSNYDDFDIVINMNSHENGVTEGQVQLDKIRRRGRKTLFVLRCGFQDCALDEYMPYAEAMFELVHKFIEKVRRTKANRSNDRILFHCYAGISRSASAAIYYIAKQQGIPTTDVYDFMRQTRRWIRPNQGFAKVLGLI